jgi:hypothetical protein
MGQSGHVAETWNEGKQVGWVVMGRAEQGMCIILMDGDCLWGREDVRFRCIRPLALLCALLDGTLWPSIPSYASLTVLWLLYTKSMLARCLGSNAVVVVVKGRLRAEGVRDPSSTTSQSTRRCQFPLCMLVGRSSRTRSFHLISFPPMYIS